MGIALGYGPGPSRIDKNHIGVGFWLMFLTKSVTAMRPPVDALIPRHAERGFHAGRAVRSPVPGDEYAQRPECAGINDDTVFDKHCSHGIPRLLQNRFKAGKRQHPMPP